MKIPTQNCKGNRPMRWFEFGLSISPWAIGCISLVIILWQLSFLTLGWNAAVPTENSVLLPHLYSVQTWWTGQTETVSVRPANALAFILSLVALFVSSALVRRPILGLVLVALLGSIPEQVEVVYLSESLLGWPAILLNLFLALMIPVFVKPRSTVLTAALFCGVAVFGVFSSRLGLSPTAVLLGTGLCALLWLPFNLKGRLACVGAMVATFFVFDALLFASDRLSPKESLIEVQSAVSYWSDSLVSEWQDYREDSLLYAQEWKDKLKSDHTWLSLALGPKRLNWSVPNLVALGFFLFLLVGYRRLELMVVALSFAILPSVSVVVLALLAEWVLQRGVVDFFRGAYWFRQGLRSRYEPPMVSVSNIDSNETS